ncbi:MAG TPA: DUF6152 family protein [Bryobacteraceae bacterium]|nr:DUF6152 family protein [Bryobacteraceae bacterium]
MKHTTLFILFAIGALAQHAATYDSERRVTLQGPVTRIEWVNPRAYLFVDVRDNTGTIENWAVEFGNPLELERVGWKPNAVKVGDVVAVEGIPARGPARQALATSLVLAGSGKKLSLSSSPRRAAPRSQPAPRWPDGRVRLGPPPGKTGYWGAPSATVLVENTAAKIPMSAEGLLKNIADADKVAPFLPWAKAVYEYRQRTLLKDDPVERCLPPGGPRAFQTPNGFQFLEQRELGRILVMFGGGDRNWRVIYTDGRKQGEPDEVVRGYYGNSVGRWEGDRLMVDVIGFNEHFWMTAGGLPHTEALHLTERFSRPDFNTLKYEVTVDDPRTYTRPWTGAWTVQWVPDQDIQEYFCEESAEATFTR